MILFFENLRKDYFDCLFDLVVFSRILNFTVERLYYNIKKILKKVLFWNRFLIKIKTYLKNKYIDRRYYFMTTILNTIVHKDNYKKYNDKYIKIGDEKLWKIYIEK